MDFIDNDFQSMIFLAMETTGLQKPVQITEICLLAVETDSLRKTSSKTFDELQRCDKLNVSVRPTKIIEKDAVRISGIGNPDLKHRKGFDKTLGEMILAFIGRQPQPTCLVSHYGDRYQFEILFKELAQHGLEVQPSVKVTDSCKAFRALYEGRHKYLPSFSLDYLHQWYMGEKKIHTAEINAKSILQLTMLDRQVLQYMIRGAHSMSFTKPCIKKSRLVLSNIVSRQVASGSSRLKTKSNKRWRHQERGLAVKKSRRRFMMRFQDKTSRSNRTTTRNGTISSSQLWQTTC